MTKDEIPTEPTEPKQRWYNSMDYDINPINFIVGVVGGCIAAGLIVIPITLAVRSSTEEKNETKRDRIEACESVEDEAIRALCLTTDRTR